MKTLVLEEERAQWARLLGRRVTELRLAKGVTQAEVGRRTGIQRVNIARIENGRRHVPTLDSLVRIARALDVKVSDIVEVLDGKEKERAAPAAT